MKSMNPSLVRKKGTCTATYDVPNEYNVLEISFSDYLTPENQKNTSSDRLKFRNIT